MGHEGLAVTAQLTAAGRAVESRRADRLFDDPLAAALAGEEGFDLIDQWRLPGTPGENPTIGPRTFSMTTSSRRRLQRGLTRSCFFAFTAALGILWQFGTNDPGGILAAHGWHADVPAFDAVARGVGRWPPPGVSEEVAARALATGSYFIRSERAAPRA